jgi:hypothetical protein
MVEFDKNGMLTVQEINKIIKHEEEHEIIYNERGKIRRMNVIHEALLEFVFYYAKTHIYISKVMLSGIYITKINPKHNINKKDYQRRIKRQFALILDNWRKLGLCEKYGQNTVKMNREKLKKFGLEAISKAVLRY